MKKFRIVLVSPKFGGNVGMVARAMKNFGFEDLRLVRPRAKLDAEAYARAVVRAADILALSQTHGDFEDAIKGCGLVIGTSRRYGVRKKKVISPREMAELLKDSPARQKVALVFGSEDTGLTERELKHCQWVVGIHPGTEFEILSISHAVAIVLYELNLVLGTPVERARKMADTGELEKLYRRLEETLAEIGFIEPGDPRRMMLLFRGMFNRAKLSPKELKILSGMLRQIEWKIRNREQARSHI
jgi:TrmH family RNA methyltransferase